MKTIAFLISGLVMLVAGTLNAQVSLNVNIGTPPLWGPVGYTEVQYYYLPDVEAYYDLQSSKFIYYSGGTWVHRTYLPSRYKAYDLYGGYKVVMTDYHGNTPYKHFKEHKSKYAKGYQGPVQKTYGDKPGKGYNDKHQGGDKKNNSGGHEGGKHKQK